MSPNQPRVTDEPGLPDRNRAVEAELTRVLDSDVFRSSKRCREFLRYIVDHALRGEADFLKERNIGIEVFQRSPSYEPNVDAIVRVRATEVRKRLTQYYDRLQVPPAVRIHLAPGTYVPEFHWHEHAEKEQPEQQPPAPAVTPLPAEAPAAHHPATRRWLWALAAAVCLVTILVTARSLSSSSPLHEFWKPLLTSQNPVMICLGQPVVYHLSRRVHEKYLRTQPANRLPGPYIIPLQTGDVDASDILPVPDQYVGAGSAQAAARISAILASWKKASAIRIGNDVSFSDLKNYPAVLEGAFSNDWTIRLTQKMPFVFWQHDGVRGIREQVAPYRTWQLGALQPDGKTTEDYALVARVFDAGTMEPLVEAAGITQYGTQAAGEFLGNEALFAAVMANAPADWRTRNIQVLLHVNVIGRIPGRPELVAIHVW